MTHKLCGTVLLLACTWGGAGIAVRADQPGTVAVPTGQSSQAVDQQPVGQESSDEVDSSVLEFIKEHQPELADLLTFMKKKKSKDYTEAMRESRKVRDRLLSIKDRDPDLYSVELDIWKNAAQIRLLAAAVSAKSKQLGPEDRHRLEELIQREYDLSIKRLNVEKARLESRLNQVSQQLTRRQEQAESIQAKSMKAWENRIQRSGAKAKRD